MTRNLKEITEYIKGNYNCKPHYIGLSTGALIPLVTEGIIDSEKQKVLVVSNGLVVNIQFSINGQKENELIESLNYFVDRQIT
jgi:hypothetical protein